ncbi:MAG: L,D-transpeptidase family protein [Actinomycetia bacterium]|nr:L,D-transpeptidase family protein [Actinomycetes bacterium]
MSFRAVAGAVVALLCLLALANAAPIDARRSTAAQDRDLVDEQFSLPTRLKLGGVQVKLRPHTRQVVTVNKKRGHHARVTFWQKRKGAWTRVRTTKRGHIGYGGLVRPKKRKQGTGTTPLGTYRMPRAFGNGRAPKRTRVPYHRVHGGDYWVQDNRSRYYNTRRHRAQGGFRWWLPSSAYNSSERLADYQHQYRWAIVIAFNRPDPVRRRGSGIFLHVNGKGATAGCVSAPKPFIRTVMKRLRPKARPLIAIGR